MLLSILKLIPVNIGLDSCCDVEKEVCLIIFLNTFLDIYIGLFVSFKSITGNSSGSLQFKLNDELLVVIYILLSTTSSIFINV